MHTDVYRKVERQGESIQLGAAAACVAGILTLAAINTPSPYLWLSGVSFCIGLPCGLARAFMGFTSMACDVYMNPIGWLMYPLGMLSCLASLSGFISLCYYLSFWHGEALSGFSILGVLLFYSHYRAVLRKAANQSLQTTTMAVTDAAAQPPRQP